MPKHLVSMARLLLAIVAMLVTLGLASAGRSEQALMWTEKEDGGLTMLSYGPLDPAQNPLFVLYCFSGMNIVVLDVHRRSPTRSLATRSPSSCPPPRRNRRSRARLGKTRRPARPSA